MAVAGAGSSISARLVGDPEVVSGFRESNDATASGLSGRSRKVELAGTAKSAWKSKSGNASEGSPNASSVKTEKRFGAPAGGGVRPLKSDGIMPEEALLSSGPALK